MRFISRALLLALSLLGSASLCSPQAKTKASAAAEKVAEADSDLLLSWVEGRWTLGDPKTGEPPPLKKGKTLCSISASAIQKAEGQEKLKSVREAIERLYALKAERLISPLFRAVNPSRELLAYRGGEEIIVEKSFESRDSIAVPPAMPQKGAIPAPDAFDRIRDLAVDPRYCRLDP